MYCNVSVSLPPFMDQRRRLFFTVLRCQAFMCILWQTWRKQKSTTVVRSFILCSKLIFLKNQFHLKRCISHTHRDSWYWMLLPTDTYFAEFIKSETSLLTNRYTYSSALVPSGDCCIIIFGIQIALYWCNYPLDRAFATK